MKFKLLLLLSCMGISAYAMEQSKGAFEEFLDAYGKESVSEENSLVEKNVTSVGAPVQAPIVKASLLQSLFPNNNKRSNEASVDSTKKKKCSYEGCLYETSDRGNFAAHKRLHADEKPYVCAHLGCGKAFATITYLKRHSFIHTNQKTFICCHEGCTKAYYQYCNLRTHIRENHETL